MKAIVIGSTGATGLELIKELLKDENFTEIKTFSRNSLEIKHQKLTEYLIDFNQIHNHKDEITGDVLFSALGTTKKDAGSKEAQYKIDYTYQYEFAKLASNNGIGNYILVSSVGANEKSALFYPKMKGALEQAVKKLDFKNIHIFQPPMLIRQANKIRKVEKNGIAIINKLNAVGLFKSQKPMLVSLLANKMIKVLKSDSTSNVNTYLPHNIFNL
ncbi:MAG: NAD(P)H-binding protein [Flavobacteriales bacterium]|nr:NAD(P)H-binding protein [Flavobacteriales bacterium]